MKLLIRLGLVDNIIRFLLLWKRIIQQIINLQLYKIVLFSWTTLNYKICLQHPKFSSPELLLYNSI